jgi:hypothetical protein
VTIYRASKLPAHPLLIAAYSVVGLLGSNLGQIEANAVYRSLAVSVFLACLLLAGAWLLYRDWHQAAIIASLSIVLFFSYGHLYGELKQIEISGYVLGRHRYLAPIYASVLIGAAIWIYRRGLSQQTTPWFNALGLLWLAIPLIQIFRFEFQSTPSAPLIELGHATQKPDIYYIVLDAYTREDVLREVYGVDIAPFRDELERMGFTLAECSLSNYSQTDLGFAATLNLDYLESSQSGNDRSPLFFMIRENEVRRQLENAGYVTMAYETGFAWSEWRDAEFFLGPTYERGIRLNAFETLLLRTTGLIVLLDAQTSLLPALNDPLNTHRERVLFALETLSELPSTDEPKFVFAHIVAPHKPYLFAPEDDENLEHSIIVSDGKAGQDVVGYRNQITYLNERIPAILQQIIDESSQPPIIILQGDHGADEALPQDRMAILNALYLPGADGALIDSTLSPVNTFRLIFRTYFGWEESLLPDLSYYSSYDEPYRLEAISRPCETS